VGKVPLPENEGGGGQMEKKGGNGVQQPTNKIKKGRRQELKGGYGTESCKRKNVFKTGKIRRIIPQEGKRGEKRGKGGGED